jgi:LmbE family N-acetylglucosaminyl deacetylase
MLYFLKHNNSLIYFMRHFIAFIFLISIHESFSVFAQSSAASVYQGIRKLKVVGSVLYIAAHPDDENTRLITYLANERLLRTGYLSLTRGDGGQNLIGEEQGVELGIIRTQELLAARKIDGGEQFFTRAYDFGFSKTPSETFSIWDREKILQDVVWVIRMFKPDVIITRFPTTGEGGHGHHTASAIVAEEAVKAAADPSRFPEQLSLTGGTWSVPRLFWNTFNFGGNSTIREDQLKIDVGGYNPILGKSYGEIAAESRSQHKSQGFGVAVSRGESYEYFKLIAGSPVKKDLFEGLSLSWSDRFQQPAIESAIDSLLTNFSWAYPEKSVTGLLKLYGALAQTPSSSWRDQKMQAVKDLILKASGIYLEAYTSQPYAVPGDSLQVNFLAIDRLGSAAVLNELFLGTKNMMATPQPLRTNRNLVVSTKIALSPTTSVSQPYWLEYPLQKGCYDVRSLSYIGKPENDPAFTCTLQLKWGDQSLTYAVPVRYKFTDPVKGELQWPFVVLPPVILHPADPYQFIPTTSKNQQDKVAIQSLATREKVKIGANFIEASSKQAPLFNASLPSFDLLSSGQRIQTTYPVPTITTGATLQFFVTDNNGTQPAHDRVEISYDHIPPQVYFKAAQVVYRPLQVQVVGKKIGYIPGAGDKIPEALRRMGYEVVELDEKTIAAQSLQSFDAIITGVRAHNTQEWLNGYYDKLMEYVKGGGNYIVQYNTNNQIGPNKAKMGPYPFTITRNRITNENAPVTILNPAHPLFNFPNHLTSIDFEGWVQERSSYHAIDTTQGYETLLEMADPDEKPDRGALLVTKFGKGWFTYAGVALFRQLPAGVPGAYRLFANMLALGKNEKK